MDGKSEKTAHAAAALLIGLGMVNWAAGHLFGYPVVYCLSRPLMPLLAGLAYWLWAASMVAFLVSMFVTGMSASTGRALGLAILAGVAPDWARTLFRLGLDCGDSLSVPGGI